MAIQINDLPEITINGEKLEDYVFTDMILNKELLKPNEFRFTMRKKDLSKSASDVAFELCDKLLGAKVECKVKTLRRNEEQAETGEELAFKGIIFNANTQREIMGKGVVVNCVAYSPDYLLIDNPDCDSWVDKNLKEIIEASISDYKGEIETLINPKMIDAIHYTVKYKENTYQFLSRLAQRWGEFFYFEDGKMVFGKVPQSETVKLYPDIDILGYYYDLNLEQTAKWTAFWNYENEAEMMDDGETMKATDPKDSHSMTEIALKHSNEIYKKQITDMQNSAVPEKAGSLDELQENVKADYFYKKARMMMCKGVANRSDLKLGSVIEINEYIDTESGVELKAHEPLMIIGINYKWDINGHFQCEFSAMTSALEYPPYMNTDLYPVSGVQHAFIMENNDPEMNAGRVKVQFIWQLVHNETTPWIRMSRLYAGGSRGLLITPEVGDEVLVGFVNNNVEKPFVIGAVHNGVNKPPKAWDSCDNVIKGFITKNHIIGIVEPEDGNGYIRITDKEHQYDLVLDADAKTITVKSTGDIHFEAERDITFRAKHNINMRSGHRLVETVGTSFEQHIGSDALVDIGNNYTRFVKGESQIDTEGKYTNTGGSDFFEGFNGHWHILCDDDIYLWSNNDKVQIGGQNGFIAGSPQTTTLKSTSQLNLDAPMINIGK